MRFPSSVPRMRIALIENRDILGAIIANIKELNSSDFVVVGCRRRFLGGAYSLILKGRGGIKVVNSWVPEAENHKQFWPSDFECEVQHFGVSGSR
jgi:hypothetical protein